MQALCHVPESFEEMVMTSGISPCSRMLRIALSKRKGEGWLVVEMCIRDRFMIAAAGVPSRIREGMLLLSGDVLLL